MEAKTIKYFTKNNLIEANNAAIREGRNRVLNENFLDELSDERTYPIAHYMYHKKGEIRVMVLFDVNGPSGYLDMSEIRYNTIPTAIMYEDRIEYEDPKVTDTKRPYPNGREWVEKTTGPMPVRKQGKFRKLVLEAYDNQCAVCNLKGTALLRAAHIIPVVEDNDDTVNNGICLCHNHEIAFDRGILKIKPNGDLIIEGDEDIKVDYTKMRFPKNKEDYPSYEKLKQRFDKYKL